MRLDVASDTSATWTSPSRGRRRSSRIGPPGGGHLSPLTPLPDRSRRLLRPPRRRHPPGDSHPERSGLPLLLHPHSPGHSDPPGKVGGKGRTLIDEIAGGQDGGKGRARQGFPGLFCWLCPRRPPPPGRSPRPRLRGFSGAQRPHFSVRPPHVGGHPKGAGPRLQRRAGRVRGGLPDEGGTPGARRRAGGETSALPYAPSGRPRRRTSTSRGRPSAAAMWPVQLAGRLWDPPTPDRARRGRFFDGPKFDRAVPGPTRRYPVGLDQATVLEAIAKDL